MMSLRKKPEDIMPSYGIQAHNFEKNQAKGLLSIPSPD
jgi:hypothetical protein